LEWIYGKILPGAYAHEHITHPTQASVSARLRASGYALERLRYVGFCEMIFQARKDGQRHLREARGRSTTEHA
jgi:hypothetical protein